MLGTVTLIALLGLGYISFSLWILVPAAIINGFIGLHSRPGKASMLQSRNMYWRAFFQSLPLQAILAAIVYGMGYGLRLAVEGFQ